MGRVSSQQDRHRTADADLANLRSQYDAAKGGYTVVTPARGRHTKGRTEFIKSDFTPEQGGYYADKSYLRDPSRPYAPRTGRSSRGNTYKYFNQNRVDSLTGAAGREKAIKDAATARKVAATPRKRVNPTVRGSRKNARRERALRFGREGTILTGTLGGTEKDERKRKTILG